MQKKSLFLMLLVACLGWQLIFSNRLASAQGLDPKHEPVAQIRFVHGWAGGTSLDIFVNGDKWVMGIPAGQATSYGLSTPGEKWIAVWPSGSDPTKSEPLMQKWLTVNMGLSYTFALGGTTDKADAFLYDDDIGADAEGRASLRLINLTAVQPAIGLKVDELQAVQRVAGGSESPRYKVDKSKGQAAITITGATGESIATLPPISLQEGIFYTLFLYGDKKMEQILLSYPLSNGEPPTAATWLPLQGSPTLAARPKPSPTVAVAPAPSPITATHPLTVTHSITTGSAISSTTPPPVAPATVVTATKAAPPATEIPAAAQQKTAARNMKSWVLYGLLLSGFLLITALLWVIRNSKNSEKKDINDE